MLNFRTDDYINVTLTNLLNFSLGSNYTIVVMANGTNTTDSGLVDLSWNSAQFPFSLRLWSTGAVNFLVSNGTYVFSDLSTTIVFNETLKNNIYQVVGKMGYNATGTPCLATYVNGGNKHETCYIDNILGNTFATVGSGIRIGERGVKHFNGSIYSVKIFNDTLTTWEITTLYNETNNGYVFLL